MSGSRSRRKGAKFERDMVHTMRKVMPGCGAKRGFQYRGTSDQPDVDIPYFFIECKHGKKPVVRSALRQAIDNTDGRSPLAIIKDDREDPFVVMKLDDFLAFVNEWWTNKNVNEDDDNESQGKGSS